MRPVHCSLPNDEAAMNVQTHHSISHWVLEDLVRILLLQPIQELFHVSGSWGLIRLQDSSGVDFLTCYRAWLSGLKVNTVLLAIAK